MSGILQTLFLGAAAAVKDAYFNLVTLLLNTTSTNGAQNNTFLDSSTNNFTITRNGNTTQGTFTPFSQTGWSNYFSTSPYLSVASNTAFDFGSGDATQEMWIYPTTASQNAGLFDKRSSGANYSQFPQIALESGVLKIYVSYTGSSWAVQITGATPTPNTWSHIALVRSGNTWTLYVNGVASGTPVTASGSVYASTDSLCIGASATNGTNPFTGYISNARIIKGTALYTSNFTPNTTPLTAISGTSLLTCQSNRFVDNSTNNFSITLNSTVSVQAFSPFAPTTAYDTAVVGGSGYFDGNGDYLTWTGSTVGTAAYTFECWFYTPSFGSSQTLIGPNSTSNGGYGLNITSATNIGIDNYGISANNFTVPTIAANAWHHIAVVRNVLGVTTVFLDGVRSSTGTIVDANNYGNVASIGYTSSAVNRYFNGYISNARYVTSAVYDPTSSTITIPTAPLTAITNTSLLLSATNAGIYDSAAKNVLETVGNAQVSTTQAKWGTTSMAFDGTGDYLKARLNDPIVFFGSSNWTVECWVYLNNTSGQQSIVVGQSDYANAANASYSMYVTGSSAGDFFYGSSFVSLGSPGLSSGVWTHCAWVRNGSTITFYRDGTSITSATISTNTLNNGTTNPMCVGGTNSGANILNGYIDDLRITRGLARYTANFTPPTAAFPLQ